MSEWPKRKIKRGMAIFIGIFIGNYAKNMAFKEHSSGRSMGQMDLLRKKDKDSVGFYNSV